MFALNLRSTLSLAASSGVSLLQGVTWPAMVGLGVAAILAARLLHVWRSARA